MSSQIKWHTLKNIGDIILHYNHLIFDEEKWKKWGLWKITEVTYSYDRETNLNETLFIKIGQLNLELYTASNLEKRNNLLKDAKEQTEKIIGEKIELMNEVLQILQESEFSKCNTEENLEKDIFESAIIEKLNLLEYCLLSLEFEAEKAGLPLELSDTEITKLEKNIHQIDANLFGGLIRDNSEEVILSYEYVFWTYLVKKKLFTLEEKTRYKTYLGKMKQLLPVWYQFVKKPRTEKINSPYLEYELQRADYILAFNMLVDAFWSMHHIVKSDKNAGSISDGPEWIYFPMNEKFNTITIERFFKLGMHEIETHSVTDHNSHGILGNLRWANSTKKDEGTAILMEQLFIYGRNLLTKNTEGKLFLDKSKFQINGYFSKILMWEILSNDEFMDFLELSEIIDPDIIPPTERYKRLKRNNRSWVQHKDTTYTRGLMQAIEEINEYIFTDGKKWISPEDLFIGKISFEETNKFKKLKAIKKEQWIWNENLYPIFVSDAVYYVIEKKIQGLDEHINFQDFIEHLQYKYPLLDFIKDIKEWIYFKKNSRALWIANVLLKIISNKKVENIFESANDRQKNILEKIFQTQYQPLINQVHDDLASHRRNHK